MIKDSNFAKHFTSIMRPKEAEVIEPTCDFCGERFSGKGYEEVSGLYCSKSCADTRFYEHNQKD